MFTNFKKMTGISLLVLICCMFVSVKANSMDQEEILAARFRAFKILPNRGDAPKRLVYGDDRGYIRILVKAKDGSYDEEWKSVSLGSGIGGIFIEDVNLDGKSEIVTYTVQGRILYINPDTHETLWEKEGFGNTSCLAIAQIDADEELELIFCADSHLFIYGAKTQFEKWRSVREFDAQEIVVGDVDGDGHQEIVLNTGAVLDAKFRDLDWEAPFSFGSQIELLDVDNDGVPEVIGQFSGNQIKVFDIDLRREKW